MLYIRTERGAEAPARLLHYCRNCLHEQEETAENLRRPVFENPHVGREDDDARFEHFMTANLEHDATLPRLRGVECPSNCADNEVIYVKYNPQAMRILYFCTTCKRFWRSA